jgi:hypothetical protein
LLVTSAAIAAASVDEPWLREVESRDNLFSDVWIGIIGSGAARSWFEGKQNFGRANLPLGRMDAPPPFNFSAAPPGRCSGSLDFGICLPRT